MRLSLAWSGWGKVSAARAATRLLASDPSIDLLVFTGVAGRCGSGPAPMGCGVGRCRGAARHGCPAPVPTLHAASTEPGPAPTAAAWFDWAKTALLEAHSAGELDGFARPSSGLIATGDRFIGDPAVLQALRDALPDLRAVEMEGAAVAQVAEQEGIPWLVLRVISDGADEAAAQNFEDFVKRYEQQAWRLIEALLQRCNTTPQRCA